MPSSFVKDAFTKLHIPHPGCAKFKLKINKKALQTVEAKLDMKIWQSVCIRVKKLCNKKWRRKNLKTWQKFFYPFTPPSATPPPPMESIFARIIQLWATHSF